MRQEAISKERTSTVVAVRASSLVGKNATRMTFLYMTCRVADRQHKPRAIRVLFPVRAGSLKYDCCRVRPQRTRTAGPRQNQFARPKQFVSPVTEAARTLADWSVSERNLSDPRGTHQA